MRGEKILDIVRIKRHNLVVGFVNILYLGASGNSMGDMTEGRNLAILEAWKTKNSMRSY